jgi:N-acetylneuraminic acid mutarotase
VRLAGKLPERRSNHCSFIVNDYLYIHGGRDIKEGQIGTMWKLSLQGVSELAEDETYGVSWEYLMEKGTAPGKVSHHKPAVFGNQVVIFGGINGISEMNDVFEYDTSKNTWTKLKQTGEIP